LGTTAQGGPLELIAPPHLACLQMKASDRQYYVFLHQSRSNRLPAQWHARWHTRNKETLTPKEETNYLISAQITCLTPQANKRISSKQLPASKQVLITHLKLNPNI
jgi:hypothetical protein